MADFEANISAQLDTDEAEQKLNALLNKDYKLKIEAELDPNAARSLKSSIEKGISDTKIDTTKISEKLANSFNLDKVSTKKIKSQMDEMAKDLASSFDGKAFDLNKAGGFLSGADKIIKQIAQNAKILKSKTGDYDAFYDQYKNKKIYVSDALKNSMNPDDYSELLKNNIGKIVKDATKGMSIDSIWSSLVSDFPDKFSAEMDNQADQLKHYFDVMRKAREDIDNVVSFKDLNGVEKLDMRDAIVEDVVSAVHQVHDALQSNIQNEIEMGKTTIELEVEVNKEQIASDIRDAVKSAGTSADDGFNIAPHIDADNLIEQLRSAINRVASGDEQIQVDLQINRESLQSDLNLALNDIDLPIHFNFDAAELEAQIRDAVAHIQDLEIDLRFNSSRIRQDLDDARNGNNNPDPFNLNQIQQLLHNTSRVGRQTQSVFSSLGNSFKEAFSAFTLADLITDGLYKVGDAARSAADTVREFNEIETDLAMATGESRTFVKGLMEDYNALGQEIGSVTSDVAKAADSWLRQGRSMSETNQLIKDSMVLAKDTKLDGEDASKILTATLNGFQLNADQASRINDILTSIDLKSASDAGGIGMALTKTASMAHNAGLSLEKTAATIATIKDVTQQTDETIGTSVKAILSRINNIKVGKFIDDESGEALNDTERVLNDLGLSMRDVNGQFQDSETILNTISDSWNKFDKNTQKALATAVAGQRQVNSFMAMMDNWDKVEMLTETAFNSSGTAQKKFEENYLTSLEAKTNALKASLENLSTSLISDDAFGGLVDGSKAIVDFVANTDLLKSALAGLGAAGGVFAIQQLISAFRELSNVSAAIKLSKVANMSQQSFSGLLSLTRNLSDSQTRLVLSSTALSNAQRMAILMNQGMSAAEAQAALSAMGLTAANGAATVATFSLTGALQGLWATLMANPLILVGAGVMAAVSAFSAYNRSVEETISSAKEAGNAWSESNTSLQDNVDRITELRDALASGTLSEQEAYDAKSELLSIQESLTDSYGKQVAGIDLVNGSLQEQIGLLDEVSRKEADKFLNENEKGIKKAIKEMTKTLGGDGGFFTEAGETLGLFTDDGSDEFEKIKGIVDKYKDYLFLDDMGNGEFRIRFVGDATDAEEVLNNVMTDIRKVEKEVDGGVQLGTLFDGASEALSDANEIIDKYGDLYNQAQQASLIEDTEIFKMDGKEQTAVKWLKDYTDAVKAYNDALSSGDTSKIVEAGAQFVATDTAVKALLGNSAMADYADQFAEVRAQLNEAAIAAHTFNEALNGRDSSKFGKAVKKNAKELKKLNLTDVDFKYALETDGIQDGEDAINGLVDAAIECGYISDTSSAQVEKLMTTLAELGIITFGDLETVASGLSDISDELTNSQAVLASINASTSLLTEQSTGKSITIEDFNAEELKDYAAALEYTNGSMQLNAEVVRELQQAKAEEAIATNEATKAQQQSKYMDNVREIEELQRQLSQLTDTKGENARAIQNSIDALLGENDTIVNQCSQLDILNASLREATGAYQNWLAKQNGAEKGDMFDDALGAVQHIEDITKNRDSELYGRTGRESYKAAVEFIVPDSVDTEDEAAVKSYMESISGFFKYDENGNRTGLNLAEFCQKAVDQGLMVIDEASGEYQIAGQTTMEDFAKGLNLSLPMVRAMFGELEEFDAHFDWGDESFESLTDALYQATVDAQAIQARIDEINAKPIKTSADYAELEMLNNELEKANQLKDELSGARIDAYIGLDQQINDAQAALDNLYRKQDSGIPVDSSEIYAAQQKLSDLLSEKEKLGTPTVIEIDAQITNAQNKIAQLQQQKAAALAAPYSTGTDHIAQNAQNEIDTLNGKIGALQTLKVKVESKEVDDAQKKVNTLNSTKINDKDFSVKVAAGQAIANLSTVVALRDRLQDKTITLTTRNVTTYSSSGSSQRLSTAEQAGAHGGYIGLNGTAHAMGTAHGYPHLVGHANANGSWGTKTGGMTLVGELGPEICLSPGSGRWETVGNNGAEFRYIPQGSIVFNHLQTQSLLERGFVNSRGTTLASGTALASGNAMVTGGISIDKVQDVSKPSTPTTKPSTSGSSSSGNSNNSNKSTDKKEKQKIDFIEIALQRIERTVKNLQRAAENAFSSFSTRSKALNKQIDALTSEMATQKEAYKRYIKEANSVGLSSALRKKVQSGAIDISEYDDDTQKKIQEYQKWYEAALKCKDAIEDIKININEVKKQRFENLVKKWDNAVSKLSHTVERTQSLIDRRDSYASEHVSMDVAKGTSQANIKGYQKIVKDTQALIDKRVQKLNELREELANSGIKKYTEEWYAMAEEIWNTENEIDELNANIIDASNNISEEYMKMFENVQTEYENKLGLAEHLSNYYSNAMEQAEAKGYIASKKYYEMLKGIEEQNISTLTEEKAAMEKALYDALASGEIQRGSQDYYDMRNSINSVSEALQQAKTNMIEFDNSMREVDWGHFDYLQEQISRLNGESDFLIDLMSRDKMFDDKGNITSEGKATMGLHGQNYNVLMSQADKYADEIKKINAEIANDPNNTKLIERKQQLIDAQRESIKAAEDEKQAIVDLVEEGIKAALDALKELIENYKNTLDQQKSLYDFEKKISEQTKNIASLEKQLSAYQNDNSEETQAKIQQLKVNLEKAKDDLEETQYERFISDQKILLDDLYDEYERLMNERLDNTDLLIQNVIDAINMNSGEIYDTLSTVASDVGVTLSEELQNIWDSSISGAMGETRDVLAMYGENFSSIMTSVQGTVSGIESSVNALVAAADAAAERARLELEAEEARREQMEQEAVEKGEANKNNTKDDALGATTNEKTEQKDPVKQPTKEPAKEPEKKPTTTKPVSQQGNGKPEVGDKVTYVSGEYYEDSWGNGKHGHAYRGQSVYITKIKSTSPYPYVIRTSPDASKGTSLGWVKLSQLKGYESGIGSLKQSENAWINENGNEMVLSPSRNAIMTHLYRGDSVLNAEATKNLYDFANNPSKYVGNLQTKIPKGTPVSGGMIQNIDLDKVIFDMPNVRNYNELCTQMQHDPKFEKFIQAMTIDRVSGGSANKKYNFSFKG